MLASYSSVAVDFSWSLHAECEKTTMGLKERRIPPQSQFLRVNSISVLNFCFQAAFFGQMGAVRELLEAVADPNAQDAEGCTPIFLAAQEGHEEVRNSHIPHTEMK